jgi:hypothetical protein
VAFTSSVAARGSNALLTEVAAAPHLEEIEPTAH